MFATIVLQYVKLVAISATALGLTHIFALSFTGGRVLRPMLLALYPYDVLDYPKKRRMLRVCVSTMLYMFILVISLMVGGTVLLTSYSVTKSTTISIVIVGLIPVYLGRLLVKGYRLYKSGRKEINMDLWSRYIERSPKQRVHEMLIADSEYESTREWLIFALMPPTFWPAYNMFSVAARPPGQLQSAGNVFLMASFIFVLVSYMALVVRDRLMPHKFLISKGLSMISTLEKCDMSNSSSKAWGLFVSSTPRSFLSTRWRTGPHKLAFDLANTLEKSALGLKRRLVDDEFDEIMATFLRVANALRRKAIESVDPENRSDYVELVACSVALVVVDQPARLARKADNLIPNEPASSIKPNRMRVLAGKFNGFVQSANEFTQSSWNMIKVIAIVMVFVVYVHLGKLEDIGKYFVGK